MTEQQTHQTIGNARFIVVSNFKPAGHSVEDKLAALLCREAEKTVDKTSNARYNSVANAV